MQQARDDPSLFSPLYQRYRDRIYWYLCARAAGDEDEVNARSQRRARLWF